MALFYSGKVTKPAPKPLLTANIVELDYQGLGVAKVNGKTWFVENALPAEKVQMRVTEEKRQYGLAMAVKILEPSSLRQMPKCSYFARCGGCQSQHIPLSMQREAKQKSLLQRLQKLQPDVQLMPMLVGAPWQYRRRVRLSLMFNAKTRDLEIGFRQKGSAQIVAISHCDVIEPRLAKLLPNLTALLAKFSQPKNLGHIELVAADNGVAMLLRVVKNLPENDRTLLCQFGEQQGINLFLQDDYRIQQLRGEPPFYLINEMRLQFDIRDFIQVNAQLNQQMVATALDWLDLQPSDHVLDLFCGMGNFTLPLSQLVKSAVGIEGVFDMVQKARHNAEQNQCTNVEFHQADLDQSFTEQPWAQQQFNKILLDPPRSGAAFALTALCQLNAEKILYVSCNPATLVRDAEILLKSGYRLVQTAMIDMFPNTGHLESLSLFVRK